MSEHPDYPKWGTPEWAPMLGPDRVDLWVGLHVQQREREKEKEGRRRERVDPAE